MNYPFKVALIICAVLFCTKISGTNSIINGRDPKLNEVRYMVAVLADVMCSGGIIGDRHVITAAHCLTVDENNKLKPVKVVAATNSTSEYDPKVSIVKYVKRAFVPDAYATKKVLHDIAVLELSESIEIDKNSEKLQKLDLPTPIKSNPPTYPSYENIIFKAAGFGVSKYKFVEDENGKKRPVTFDAGRLHVANAAILKVKFCKWIYGSKMENRMCMVVIDNPQKENFLGFCKGDSGAPIVVNDTIIIGVMASGNCNKTYTPSIGVRTTAFMPFIENAVNGIVTPDMKVYDA